MVLALETLRFAPTMPGQYAAATDRGQRRATNQDRALADRLPDGRSLLVVADGVGGMFGGERASEETVQTVAAEMQGLIGGEPDSLLQAAVEAANERVRQLRKEDHELAGMATTLVAALVTGDEAWLVSIGDSRAYVFKDGVLRQVTEDDSWVAEQVRMGILSPEEAEASPRQNVITRGIGVDESLHNEQVTHVRLGPGAMLLLCSDGLFRAISEEEIASMLPSGKVGDVVANLIERANAAGGPDNIGIALYRQDVDVDTERD
ncbi:hypothetical protein AYO38_00735 [bacterium SCGC AG-212-C10]|nr:hypothetical protein AYO38_00735 [bacterium SCGC AG-212-C10]